MVHKKYTYKDGRRFGPYYYETKRVNGKVVTTYLGSKNPDKKIKFQVFFGIGILAVLLLSFFVLDGNITGNVSLSLKSEYELGDAITGKLIMDVKEGELVPAESLVLVELGSMKKSFLLSDMIGLSTSDLRDGKFYVEGFQLSGSGEGYGLAGTQERYPRVEFELIIEEGQIEKEVKVSEGSSGEGEKKSEEKPSIEVVGESGSEEGSVESTGEVSEGEKNSGKDESGEISENGDGEGSSGDSGGDSSSSGDGKDESSESSGDGDSSSSDSGSSDGSGSSGGSGEGGSDSSSSSDSGSEGSVGAGITGGAITEFERIVSGSVSKEDDFEYALSEDERAFLKEGSVKINGELVEDSFVKVKSQKEKVVVMTDYSVEEEGFGEDYLGKDSVKFKIDLVRFDFLALKDNTFKVSLVYDEETLAEISEEISVRNSEVKNKTQVAPTENENKTALNRSESFMNRTVILRNESLANATELVINTEVVQFGAVLGKPVRWERKVSLSEPSNLTLELPADAVNISVLSLKKKFSDKERIVVSKEESKEVEEEIIIDSESGNGENTLEGVEGVIVRKDNSILTGKVIEDIEKAKDETNSKILVDDEEIETKNNVIFKIDEDVEEVELEYYTSAPYAFEEDFKRGKKVEIVGSEHVHYQNVLVFTSLNDSLSLRDVEKLKVYWLENDSFVDFSNVSDKNSDGNYDYVEWVAPRLSNQTFIIIVITRAEHLDENRQFISDIFGEVRELDGNWSEAIPEEHYVRVEFERNLTNSRDISVFPRTVSGTPRIEVYEENGDEIIAQFDEVIDSEYNKVYLTGLKGSQDVFDLKILEGSLEFDHIVDPETGLVPNISFTANTPADGSTQTDTDIFSEISSADDSGEHYVFTNFADDLVLWMRFDDVDGSGNPTDLSSYGNDGTLAGNALINDTGYWGNASWYNKSIGTRATILNSPELNFPNRSFSVSFWVYPREVGATYQGMAKRHNSSPWRSWGFAWNTPFITPAVYFQLWNSTGDTTQIQVSKTGFTANKWHHVVGTYNGDTDVISIYLNGAAGGTATLKETFDSDSNLLIGDPLGSNPMYGAIDELLIFNKSLTSTEILALYNATANQYSNNFTSLSNGTYTFTGHAVDSSGNRNQTEGRVVTVDTAFPPPDVNITFPDGRHYGPNDMPLDFAVVLNENGSVEYSLNGGTNNFTMYNGTNRIGRVFNHTNTSIATGQYTFTVYANDTGGARNYTENVVFSFDSTAPVVAYEDPTPADSSSQETDAVTINVSSSDLNDHYTFVDFYRSLVFWMRFDDTNSTGDPIDLSPYGRNGTLSGNALINSTGYWGNGSFFDGIGDSIVVNNTDSLLSVSGNLTVSVWVKPTHGSETSGAVVWKGHSLGLTDTNYHIRAMDSQWRFAVFTSSTKFVTGGGIGIDEWVHVLGTYNGTDVALYVNGTIVNSSAVTGNIRNTGNAPLVLGARQDSTFPFNGSMDDVLVFNRSLSAGEVSALYNASANQYVNNFTNLDIGSYSFKAYSVDVEGNRDSTVQRSVEINSSVSACKNLDEIGKTYVINGDINSAGTCFVVSANDIVLDGKGYALTGNGSGYGVDATDRANFTVWNITISNFSSSVYLSSSSATGNGGNIVVRGSDIDNVDSHGGSALVSGDSGGRGGNITLYLSNVTNLTSFGGNGIGAGNGGRGGEVVFENVDLNLTNGTVNLAGGTGNSNGVAGTLKLNFSRNFYDQYANYGSKISLIIVNASASGGEIKWLSELTSSGLSNLSTNVTIEKGFTEVNTNVLTGLNVTANITFYGTPASGFVGQELKRNGGSCGAFCYNFTSLTASVVVFNVSSWTNYSLTEVDNEPNISFTSNTPANASTQSNTDIFVEVNSSDDGGDHYTFADFDDDLVFWMRFDDTNSTGDPTDLSSYGNNGALAGNALINSTGYWGNASWFDDAVGSKITIQHSRELSHPNKSFSVSAWIYPRDVASTNFILAKRHSASPFRAWDLSVISTPAVYFQIYNSTGHTTPVAAFKTGVVADKWQHVAVTYNGSAVRVYLDGVGGSSVIIPPETLDANSDLLIGDALGSNPMYGGVDDFLMFNRSLSSDEVLSLFNATADQYFHNFTGLSVGVHDFVSHAVDRSANRNNTGVRRVTINNAPTAPTPEINSTDGSNKTTQDLNCFDTISDPDSDAMNVSVRWYNDSGLHLHQDFNDSYASGLFLSTALNSANTTKGMHWFCSVRLFDGVEHTVWVNSSNLTVLNSPPSVPGLSTPADGATTTDRTPTFTWDASSDDDSDTLTYDHNITLIASSVCVDGVVGLTESISGTSHTPTSELKCLYDNNDYYNWTVRAYDGEEYSAWATHFRINITALIAITLPNSSVEFGDIYFQSSNDTTDNKPSPFLVQNDGNAFVNITIGAGNLWNTISNPNKYYQFKIDNYTSENGSFNWGLSFTTFTNMSLDSSPAVALVELNYTDATDTAEVDISIEVPSNEGSSVRSSTVNFTASLAE